MMRAVSFLLVILLLSAPALADTRPAKTQDIHIAMLYHKLTNKGEPDYEKMIGKWSRYQKANLMERSEMLEKYVPPMKEAYDLITPTEPIVANVRVKISGYSPSQKGFFVQSFNDMTFFKFMYMDQRYMVIPSGIAEYQWLKAPPGLADIVMRETKNGHDANLTLTLISLKVDPNPMIMDKLRYNLLLAEISKIELWSKDGKSIIWDSAMGSRDRKRNELLNMHQ